MSKYVGQRIKRTEDPRLIKGLAHYVDDVRLPDTLHVAFVPSIYAHARIAGIDVTEAVKAPGVVAVYTGKDIAKVGPVPCAAALPDLKVPDYRVLATGKALFVGHPIAAVVATDKYLARDAADLISVDYEELPVVVDVEAAAKGGHLVHEQFANNVAYTLTSGEGDIDAAMKSADTIVSQKMVHQRLAPIAMEPRGVLARYFPGEEELTIWSSTQIPHLLRTQLALMIGIPENKLRVITPEVGGGFGSKLNVYAEEALLGWIAMQLGKPVKWIETRRENMQATIHGRGQVGYIEIGCKNDGTITGLRYNVFADMGAYHQLLTPAIPTLTGLMLSGCYKIPAIQMNITACFTNKMATDAYRGAGRPEATYVVERAVDLVARELGLDPAEVRRKNFISPDSFPYDPGILAGLAYDTGNYEPALDRALDLVDYRGLRAEQEEARKSGRYVGIGLSSYVELCGVAPSNWIGTSGQGWGAGLWESANVRVHLTGKVVVTTGCKPFGQGHETTMAQIVADELGVALDDVTVEHGDTLGTPFGYGTYGSRSAAVGAVAVYNALQRIKAKARRIAAHMLEADAEDVVYENGRAFVAGSPDSAKTIQEIAAAAAVGYDLPPGDEPFLDDTSYYDPPNCTFPFGTHVAVVEIDPETGEGDLRRYVAVDDVGRVINPPIGDGQVHGGIAQGVAQALWEGAVYDENGQLQTSSLMDYAVPKAEFLPAFEVERTETLTDVN